MPTMQRVQYITVQECQRVVVDTEYGHLRFKDATGHGHENRVGPVYVAGVSVEQLPLYYRQFFTPDIRFSVSQFLSNFWSRRYVNNYASDVCGKPDVLVIDRRLETCLDAAFFEWLDKEGVGYRYPAPGDSKFPANTRYHQRYPHGFKTGQAAPVARSDSKTPWPLSLDVLNAHEASRQNLREVYFPPAVRKAAGALYGEEFRPEFALASAVPHDFVVNEKRLRVHAVKRKVQCNLTWYPDLQTPFCYGHALNINGASADAGVGLTRRQKIMLLALECLESQIDGLACGLADAFGDNDYLPIFNKIKRNSYRALWPLDEAGQSTLFELAGLNNKTFTGNALYNVSKLSMAETVTLWNHITDGGNQHQSFEIRPRNGVDDAQYRLFAVTIYQSRYFLVSERTTRSCDALDLGHCINYEPGQSLRVPLVDFRKMLNCVVRGREKAFAAVFKQYADDLCAAPGSLTV